MNILKKLFTWTYSFASVMFKRSMKKKFKGSKTQPTEKKTLSKEEKQSHNEIMIRALVNPGVYAKYYALRYQIGDSRLFFKRKRSRSR
jgi:hypothetical protein